VGEDFAAFPAQALLLLVGTAACLAGRRRTALVRGYAAVVVIAGIAFIAAFSWQPWINRLDVPMIAMAAPAAGVWLEGLLNLASGWRRALATVLVTALITTAWGFGGYALAYGFPRPLLGSSSVLTTDRETVLWAHGGARTAWRTAAATARASDPATVGLVQTNNSREYLWWRYLRPDGKGPEIVSLTSTLPHSRAFGRLGRRDLVHEGADRLRDVHPRRLGCPAVDRRHRGDPARGQHPQTAVSVIGRRVARAPSRTRMAPQRPA